MVRCARPTSALDDLLDFDPTGGVTRFGGNRTRLLDAVERQPLP